MKRLIVLLAVLAVCACASVAMAETNGQATTNSDVVRNSGQALGTMVQSRIANIAAPKPAGFKMQADNYMKEDGTFAFSATANDLGLSSGDAGNEFGIWGMGSYTHFESDASGAKYDADAYNLLVGFDWRVTPEFLIGVAGGYGDLDLDKKEWTGGDNGTLQTEHEWTIMPYLAWNITDTTIFDAAFAYTDSEYKDDNSTDSGKYDSKRYLTNVGISQYWLLDNWTLSGRLGYMYVHGDLSSYSRGSGDVANEDSFLGQVSLEGKAAYFFDNGLEPYAALRYYYDTTVSQTPVGSDYDEFEGIAGLNWYIGDQWTINAEGGASMGREDYDSYRGQMNIRYEF